MFFLCNTQSLFAQWTTANNGNWSSAATWTSNTIPPTSGNLGTVTINHNVTLDQNATASTLNIAGGTFTTSGANMLSVTGTATVSNGATFTNNSSNASNISIGSFVVSNGGTYNHNAVGSSSNGASSDFPGTTRSFGATSNVVITKWASGGTTPAALPLIASPGWGNLTINIASLSGSWKQSGSIRNIQGNLTIQSTGPNREFRLFEVVTGSVNTLPSLTINGNLKVNGGYFSLLGGSTTGSASTLRVYVNGDITLNGGTFNLTGNNGFTSYFFFNFNYCYLYLNGNLSINAPAILTQPKDVSVVSGFFFIKNGTQYVNSYSGGVNYPYIGFGIGQASPTSASKVILTTDFDMTNIATTSNIFRVYDQATLSFMGESKLTGNTEFTVFAGGTLEISSAQGITSVGNNQGNIRTTNNRIYNSAAHYIYTGTNNQVTGNGLPSTISGSLTVNNTGATGDNLVTLTSPVTVSGKLSLQDGLFTTGASNLLTLSSAGTLDPTAAGSSDSYVNGPMARGTNSTNEYAFPVGKTGGTKSYRPVSIIPASSSGSTFLAEYNDGPTPNTANLLSEITSLENNEYWNINRTSGSAGAVVKLNYENPGLGSSNWTPINPCSGCHVAVAQYNTSGAGYWETTDITANLDPLVPETRPYTSDGILYSATINSFSISRPFTAAVYVNTLLPVSLVYFKGKETEKGHQLDWEIDHPNETASIILEYSKDGQHFQNLASFRDFSKTEFTYLNRLSSAGRYYYRLLITEKTGREIYSTVISIQSAIGDIPSLNLFQNPGSGHYMLKVVLDKPQILMAVVRDGVGKIYWQKSQRLTSGENQLNVDLGHISSGIYLLSIYLDNGFTQTLQFLKQKD